MRICGSFFYETALKSVDIKALTNYVVYGLFVRIINTLLRQLCV
jgi:hypothetical protein